MHQRILSAASSKRPRSYVLLQQVFSFILGIPSVLLGAVAASTGQKNFRSLPLYQPNLYMLIKQLQLCVCMCVHMYGI
uniref:Uncharacterized protein n=1 Tax=Anguilla anguilla TaxID=7936 RepID=A0A0E9PGV0_ANGAN